MPRTASSEGRALILYFDSSLDVVHIQPRIYPAGLRNAIMMKPPQLPPSVPISGGPSVLTVSLSFRDCRRSFSEVVKIKAWYRALHCRSATPIRAITFVRTSDISVGPGHRIPRTHRSVQPSSAGPGASLSMPTEILIYIFMCLAAVDVPRSNKSAGALGWIRITHVCRRWRFAALDAPFLWTDLVTLGGDGMKAMLRRAGQLPLTVDNYVASWDRLEEMQMLASRISQIRTLDVSGWHNPLHLLFDRLHEPAPQLEILKLRVPPYGRSRGGPSIRGSVLSGNCPSLRHLSIHHVFFDWKDLCFPGLVSLELVFQESGNDAWLTDARGVPSVSTMLSALAKMPKLRSLKLHHCISDSIPSDPPQKLNSAPISLPHLSTLDFRLEAVLCSAILQCLEVPEGAVMLVLHVHLWKPVEDVWTLFRM
ncbi:hypothetical protein EVG20_g4095 [Dentipellis fragilis]|uniref:F-box domain-containing protein n=1 Tax=Dentipellis fragilis TaxID=205917 RepID=A0A4Y9YZ19_9AGAM|nr:hypothetical protein EVG20_g4095 [Dentipellis fragilis]